MFFQFQIIINVLGAPGGGGGEGGGGNPAIPRIEWWSLHLALCALFVYPCYGFTAIIHILIFQCGDRLYKSESDVYTADSDV